jgi:hypothetical protein
VAARREVETVPGEENASPRPAMRAAALDLWCLHLLRCPACTHIDDLHEIANRLVSSLGDGFTY